MKKMHTEQIHAGLNTLALSLDTQWFGLNREDVASEQRKACNGLYLGMLQTLSFMGGDWKRDAKGHHRVFLAGMSSVDVDDYNNEEG